MSKRSKPNAKVKPEHKQLMQELELMSDIYDDEDSDLIELSKNLAPDDLMLMADDLVRRAMVLRGYAVQKRQDWQLPKQN